MAKKKEKDTANYIPATVRQSSVVAEVAAVVSKTVERPQLEYLMQLTYNQLVSDLTEGILMPKEKIQLFAKLLDIKFPRAQQIELTDRLSDEAKTLAQHINDLANE